MEVLQLEANIPLKVAGSVLPSVCPCRLVSPMVVGDRFQMVSGALLSELEEGDILHWGAGKSGPDVLLFQPSDEQGSLHQIRRPWAQCQWVLRVEASILLWAVSNGWTGAGLQHWVHLQTVVASSHFLEEHNEWTGEAPHLGHCQRARREEVDIHRLEGSNEWISENLHHQGGKMASFYPLDGMMAYQDDKKAYQDGKKAYQDKACQTQGEDHMKDDLRLGCVHTAGDKWDNRVACPYNFQN